MNGLDYLIVALIGLGAIFGAARGILRIAASLIALVAAFYLAAVYYGAAGAFFTGAFSLSPRSGSILGYIVVFMTVMIIVAWGGTMLSRLIHAIHMSWADRLAGAIVGAALGAMAAGLIVVMLAATLPADAPMVRNSTLAPRVLDYNHSLLTLVPEPVREAYHAHESQLISYWNRQANSPPPAASATPAPR